MAVPKFFEFFEEFLHAVEDGNLHSAKEVREIIASAMHISNSEREEILPSGQSTFDNRGWMGKNIFKQSRINQNATTR